MAFPQGTVGPGATRGGGWDGRAHPNPSPCRTRHPEGMGRSRPRPQTLVRHARSGDCTTNAMTPATCGTGAVHVRNALFMHIDLDVTCASPDRHRERSKPPPSDRFRPWISKLRQAGGRARFPARFRGGRYPPKRLLLAEAAPLRDNTVAQIVRSINRERN